MPALRKRRRVGIGPLLVQRQGSTPARRHPPRPPTTQSRPAYAELRQLNAQARPSLKSQFLPRP